MHDLRRNLQWVASCAGSVQQNSTWFVEENALLTEAEVQRIFNNLFKGGNRSPDVFEKAEALLDELRPESPLRHRLGCELEELRKMCETD